MTALIRFEAGTTAPASGTYALVGHYGEETGFAVWCNAGEKLPLALISVQVAHPLWFHQVGGEMTGLLAA